MIQFINLKGGSETEPLSHVTPRDAELGVTNAPMEVEFRSEIRSLV